MELPKNIVQIGRPDKLHRVFAEDYVISYMKQINRRLQGNQAGLAFYGKKYVENSVRYYFLYGASEIPGLEGRGQYLSELEKESIEARRKEFFEEHEFLGWCTLGGEMPDGFFLLEQGKGLFISGYAGFFEKNDCMLNFMVVCGNREREKEWNAEEQGQEWNRNSRPLQGRSDVRNAAEAGRGSEWGRVKEWGRLTDKGNIDHRLNERSRKLEEMRNRQRAMDSLHRESNRQRPQNTDGFGWKTVLAGTFVLLCVLGIATLSDEDKMQELQVIARQVIESMSEQKLPDREEVEQEGSESMGTEQTVTAQTESAPTDGGQTEAVQTDGGQTEPAQTESEQTEADQAGMETTDTPVSETEQQETITTDTSQTVDPQPDAEPADSEQVQAVSYVIRKGDTLLNICRQHYGSEARLQEICELNGIENADDIKIGQIILLPE